MHLQDIDRVCADFYTSGIAVWPGFISLQEADILREEIKKQENSLFKAGIGNGRNLQVKSEIRGDFIKWIDEGSVSPFSEIYLNKLKEIIAEFNRRFFLGIQKNEHHMALYPAGSHYDRHVDTFKNTDARVVSSVLYLNSNWEKAHGGELVIYPENAAARVIEPRAGLLALFESTLPHEVLTSQVPRYSITGWFKRN